MITDPVIAAVPVYVGTDALLTQLTYTAADPYAVRIVFVADLPGGPSFTWILDRGMLRAGRTSPTDQPLGFGDIQISGDGGWVWIRLASDTGQATIRLRLALVEEFLDATYELVPAGTESGHVDFDIAELFTGGASWE